MYIKELYIKSFGALTDRKIELSRGLNVICGANESGKSTVASFIKFMLYGLSGKAAGNDSISERERAVNWENGIAAGRITVVCADGEYNVERRCYRTTEGGRDTYREGVKIVKCATGEAVKTTKSPGEYFLGFPEKVFVQSAYVKSAEAARIDGGGLKVALENLMSSGDEEINTKRALDRLDAARKMLRHKNGAGGRLGELEEERARLESLLKDSQGSSKRIVELEGNIADVRAKREHREAEAQELSALCKAYEAVRIGAKVNDIEKCEAEVASIEKELSALDPAIDDELLVKIDLCSSAVADTERDIATLSKKRAEFEEKREGRDGVEPAPLETVLSSAKKYSKGSAFCLSLACTLAVLSILGAVACLIPGIRSALAARGFAVTVIVMTFISLLFSVAGFIGFRFYSAAYEKVLDEWGAEDGDSLESAVLAKHDSYKYTLKLDENINRIDTVTDEAILKHDREIDRGMALGAKLGIKGDNVFEVLDAAKEAARVTVDRRHELVSKLEGAKGRLSAIVEDIGEEERGADAAAKREELVTPFADRVMKMSRDDYNRSVRERDFALSAAASLKDREASLERELTALSAAGKTPSEVAGRITVIDRESKELTKRYEALVTASEALERAGGKMRADVMPHVVRDAASVMERVTGGKYGTLASGESFELTVDAGGERRTVDYLSDGTKDISYISVRCALVNVLYGSEVPPMVFDECFARVDGARRAEMMKILSADGMPQALVFTCRPEDVPGADSETVML